MSANQHTPSTLDGTCPNGWQEKSLVSVAELRVSNVDKKSESGEKPVRLCNYTDVYGNDYINADMEFMRATATTTEIAKFGLKVGDVIITKDSETPDDIGVPTVVDSTAADLVCGYHLALLRPNQKEIDPTFLAKQLSDPRIARYFGRQANGSTRYGLSTASIERTPLWLPDPPVQQAVGRLVRLMAAAIARTEAVIAKLKQVRTGLLHDLLTRGLDDNGELRDPLSQPEEFQDTSLGRIPKAWDVKAIDQVCHLGRGRVISNLDLEENPGMFPVYSSQSANSGIFGFLGTFDFEGDYVTWTTDGANAGTVFFRSGRFNCTNVCGTLKSMGHVVEAYLALALIPRTKKHVSYVGNPKLMNNVMAKIAVPVPQSQDEQSAIVAELAQLDSRINCDEVELMKLSLLKSGLVSDLLTGRVLVLEQVASANLESTA